MFFLYRGHTVFPQNVRVVLFFIGLFCVQVCAVPTALGATAEVVYQSDFASDPEWITDQPENFFWDSTENALRAHTYNQPATGYSPSRHYYTKTTLNPKFSYELTWDMKILSVQGGNTSGVAVFGLYGNRLYGFNPLNLNFGGNDQDGTFSTRLMTLDGNSRYVFTEVNPGFNYNIGKQNTYSFAIGSWYTLTERYTASTYQYYFEIKDRATGDILFAKVIQADPNEPVNPDLQNLGISMHPEGDSNTNLGQSARIGGSSEYLIDNVLLTQVYDETYTEPSSVLFLPGIQASRLYKDGILGTEDQLWEPNINGDVAQLEMTEDGQSVEDVYTRDIIDTALSTYDIYGSFETYLNTIKSQGIISDWVPYAYDWRYAVSDVVRDGTKYETEQRKLIEIVETLAKKNNSHVTIIAHSNGGLLAKTLVRRLEAEGKANLIDRIIFVASPQLGTPKAIGSVLHGLDQEIFGGIIVDDETARETMRNFPGVYGLVPSEEYFARTTSPVVSFDTATTTKRFVSAYGATVDSLQELQDFMVGTVDGRPTAHSINEASDANATMLSSAHDMHKNELDTWIAPAHVQVVEIVGVGLDTVKGFQYQEFVKKTCVPAGGAVACAYDPYYEPVPLLTQYGDETVTALSAEAYGGTKLTYYIDLLEVKNDPTVPDRKHSDITGLATLQQFIGGLLQNTTVAGPFIYGTQPVFATEREMIAVHSPVSLMLTDALGNSVGRNSDGKTVLTDIPGSSYLEIGGATYIIVPSATAYEARIEGKGEGSYTLTVDTLRGEDAPMQVSILSHATTTATMSATFSKSGGVYSDIVIDYDGNGTTDEMMTLRGEPTTATLYTTLKNLLSGLTTFKESERSWLISAVERAEKTNARKGSDANAITRILSQVDGRLIQYRNAGRISEEKYTEIYTLMQRIISR